MTFESFDVLGLEHVVSDSTQARDAESSTAKLGGQTQVKHGCVIVEIFYPDVADDTQIVIENPEGVVVIIAEGASADHFHDFVGRPGRRPNMEREVIAGEEFDESGTIGTIGIEA
ncbi:hypothetical protein BAU01nite_28060 [Brevibacterium aurantiacum]|nr:hypothetical protein BAU01nite_28060 [Brevibacterium aurantiacum]